MEIEIRPARPEDVEEAIPLLYSSGPAAFDYVFSHNTRMNTMGYLHRAFQEAGGEFGYANHYVVELDGKVIGAGAGYSGKTGLGYMLTALRQILTWYGPLQGAGVIRRGLQVERIVQPPKSNLYCVSHLGVNPDYRGRGIGEQLVDFLLKKGREQGFSTSVLDVSFENPRAEALYTRLGFTTTAERISTYENATAKVPSHRRMELPL